VLAIPFPHIDPVAIEIGPIALRWYGLAYAAGFLAGWALIARLVATPSLWSEGKPPPREALESLVIYVVLGVVIGGRLGHVLFYEPSFYLRNPLEILQPWKGGMAFHGGLIGTIAAICLFARRHGLNVWSVFDLVAAAVPIGIGLGRLANFINGEVVGSVTSMPWGMVFPNWGPEPRHPAMLYEAALEGVVLLAVLLWLIHKRLTLRTPGLTSGWFLIVYGAFRIFCEFFKLVEFRLILPPLPLTTGMLLSVPMILFGVWLVRTRGRARAFV
jgi:phosphatidylglycerol:prolipoprotein diacylglycerol transferase